MKRLREALQQERSSPQNIASPTSRHHPPPSLRRKSDISPIASSLDTKNNAGMRKASQRGLKRSKLRPPGSVSRGHLYKVPDSQSPRMSPSTLSRPKSTRKSSPLGAPIIKETKASLARKARGKAMREYQAMSPSMQRKHSMLLESATPSPMTLSSKTRLSGSGSAPRLGESGSSTKFKRESRERSSLNSKSGKSGSVNEGESLGTSVAKNMSRSELRTWAKQHPGLGVNGNSSSVAIRAAIVKFTDDVSLEHDSDAESPSRFGWSGHSSSSSGSGSSKKEGSR